MDNQRVNRRRLFQLGAAALTLPVLSRMGLGSMDAQAAQCPAKLSAYLEKKKKKLLNVNKPKAQKQGYVLDASILEPAKKAELDKYYASIAKKKNKEKATKAHKKYVAGKGHKCDNCQFYKIDKKRAAETAGYGKCSMFGNKYVSACGWCGKYKAKKG